MMAEKPDPDTNLEPDTRLRPATPIDPEIPKPKAEQNVARQVQSRQEANMTKEIDQSQIRHDPASRRTFDPDHRPDGQTKQPGRTGDAPGAPHGKANTRDDGKSREGT